MSFTEKIDVLELLIELIRDHEQKLSLIVEKIELLNKMINTDIPPH